jgi:DNA-binding transcriptional MerR regulator
LTHDFEMKQEFSQMAFDFPMAEPQAPSQNAAASHNGRLGNNSHGLSPEEEQAVHEEGRRAGVVVRFKSLKSAETQAAATPAIVPPVSAQSSQLEALPDAPPLTAQSSQLEAPPAAAPRPAPEPMFVQMELLPRPEPLPEPPPTTPEPEPSSEPDPVPEPGPLPKPEPTPRPIAPSLTAQSSQLEAPPAPTLTAQSSKLAAKTAPARPAEKPKSKRGRKSLKQVAAEADLINIPDDEILFSKQYYTMGEVAEMFRVNQSLLRFWETEFSILQPKKNKKGDRYFRPVDIKNLHLIYHLLRQRKYTIEGAKDFLKKNKTADKKFETIQRLQEIRAFLLELKAQL